ncbi:hypothetical protein [Winogradskyella sp. 3972H.M.0a.05]|uniref:hypothetical protein n=1 Tax=Winogradskyella sp. 3972H.M.0a.05 TaxID=2950277 RepID=UPI00339A3A63
MKLFKNNTAKNELNDLPEVAIDYQAKDINKKNDFSLDIEVFNPFGASSKRNKKKSANTTKSNGNTNTVKMKSNNTVSWPAIRYYGFVRSGNNNNRLVLLKVNNQLHRKREQERIDDILITKAYSDSIILILNKEKKTIPRQHD